MLRLECVVYIRYGANLTGERVVASRMSMDRLLLRCVVSLSLLLAVGDAYRPVILMHGILSGAGDMSVLHDRILAANPGTDILNVALYEDLDSVKPMAEQVAGVQKEVTPFLRNATDGVNMICYSQGKQVGGVWASG